MATVKKSSGKSGRRRPPARSLENRENQLIAKAYGGEVTTLNKKDFY